MALPIRTAMLSLLFVYVTPGFAAGLCFTAYEKDAQAAFTELNELSERTFNARTIEAVGVGLGLAVAKYAKSPVGGVVLGGLIVGFMESSNYFTEQRRQRLAGAEILVRAYEEFRLRGETEQDATQALMKDARVQKQNEKEVMTELVRRMDTGALCEDGLEPKPLGKIISELRDYEAQHVRGLY